MAPVLYCVGALAFFRFGRFLQRLTQKIDHQEGQFNRRMDHQKEKFTQRMDHQEEQFNRRMDYQDERLTQRDEKFNQRMDHQEEKFNQRMDHQEEKFNQRMDHQEERLSEVVKEFKESIKYLLQRADRQEERFIQRMDRQDEKTSEVTKEAQGTSRNLSILAAESKSRSHDLSVLTVKVDKVTAHVNKSTTEAGVLAAKGELVYRYMDLASLQPNAGNSPLALTSIGKKMVSSLDAHKMLDKYLPQLKAWIDEKKIGTAYDIQMHSVDITRYDMLKLLDEDDLVKVKDEAYHRNMPLVVVMEVFATLLRDAVFNDRGMPLPFPKGKAIAKGTVAKKRSK